MLRKLARAFGLMLAITLGAGADPGKAQTFPSQTVTIVMPFLAGGAVDVIARLVAAKLQEYWGQPVVVENKPGAGGTVGSLTVATAPADGYRLLIAPQAPVSYNVYLYKNMPYDPVKAFAPITLFAKSPNFLIVARDSEFNSVADLVAAAKANPGKITYASQGIGTTPHLTGARFGREAGIDIVHVPYRGFPPAITDLIGKRLSFMFADSGNTLPQVANKAVKVLAIASDKRWPDFPDVKTMEELGYPGFISNVWYCLLAPANTPAPVIEKIRADVLRAASDPETLGKLKKLGIQVAGTTPDDSRAILASETQKWGDLIRAVGVTAE